MRLIAGLACLAAAAAALLAWQTDAQRRRDDTELSGRMALIVEPASLAERPCTKPAPGEPQPLVLLVLGQSNAGNHGAPGVPAGEAVELFTGVGCVLSADPLPGATGGGHAIWSRLPLALRNHGVPARVQLVLLAVDASSIDDWTREGSPLRAALDRRLAEMAAQRLAPAAVLWQQGEADAARGTALSDYLAAFEALRGQLRAAGVAAPVVMARSSRCRRADGTVIRDAMRQLAAAHPDLRLGPDLDTLGDAYRFDGCHFNAAGLWEAADAWALALLPLVQAERRAVPSRPAP